MAANELTDAFEKLKISVDSATVEELTASFNDLKISVDTPTAHDVEMKDQSLYHTESFMKYREKRDRFFTLNEGACKKAKMKSPTPLAQDYSRDQLTMEHLEGMPPEVCEITCSESAVFGSNNNNSGGQLDAGPIADDTTVNEVASYLELMCYIPRKMSTMAESMYT